MKCLSFLLILILSYPSYSQTIQVKIADKNEGTPLPYATVVNLSNPYIVSTNKDGIAYLKGNQGDTVSITYIGYKSAVYFLKVDTIQEVFLTKSLKALNPVTIKTCKTPLEQSYINFEEKKGKKKVDTSKKFGGVHLGEGKRGSNYQIAVLFNPKKANSVLHSFSFWIEKPFWTPPTKTWIDAPLIISFYEVSGNSNLPGELISSKPLIYFPKKEGKQTVNVDSFHINIPEEGIYIGLQYLMNEEYSWKYKTRWGLNLNDTLTKDTTLIIHGGTISGTRSEDFDLVFYNVFLNGWISPQGRPIPANKIQGTIKCEVVIKYCKE